MFDLDDFKRINDQHGHQVGDRVLVELVAEVRRNIRATDTFGRWGGEEFLLVCPETDLEGAQAMAELLRLQVSKPRSGPLPQVTASFGVTSYHEGDSEHDQVRRADQALYAAKRAGKNRVEVAM